MMYFFAETSNNVLWWLYSLLIQSLLLLPTTVTATSAKCTLQGYNYSVAGCDFCKTWKVIRFFVNYYLSSCEVVSVHKYQILTLVFNYIYSIISSPYSGQVVNPFRTGSTNCWSAYIVILALIISDGLVKVEWLHLKCLITSCSQWLCPFG